MKKNKINADLSINRTSRLKRSASSALLNIVLLVFGLLAVVPFVWMVLSAFKSNAEIKALQQTFLPLAPTLDNFRNVLQKFDFSRYFLNSLGYAVAITVITIYTSALSGFVLCKYKFRGREALFTLILMTMMVPGVVTIIPRFTMMQDLKWLDSLKALLLPSLFTSFGVFLMRQACAGIPDEIIEAARMDGANEFYIFHRIILPQLHNSIVSMAIFQFLWAWDDYLWPYLVMQSGEKQMLSVALNMFSGQYSTDYAGLFAATCLAIIPVVVVYLIFQKKFIAGVSASAVKG